VHIAEAKLREIVQRISDWKQVTLPSEVLRALNAKPGDKVAFQIEGSEVRLVAARFTLASAYGSVKPRSEPEDLQEISRVAKDEHAATVVREMNAR
jgi:bifunctional DNA-binding transcriptional regulator/antitoxin component of YhaV-PrlF toxin-antitoxin module